MITLPLVCTKFESTPSSHKNMLIQNCGADYHSDVNSAVFEKWVQELIHALKEYDRPVVCLDNAPYHSRILEKIQNSNLCLDVIK